MFEAFFFYLFSILALAGGVLTVTRRNVVISAVWLIVSLLGVAGLFLLQGAEFLFVAQLILYIGGVVLLFLIALMLINWQALGTVRRFRAGWPGVLGAVVLLGAELVYLLRRKELPVPAAAGPAPSGPNTAALADALFSHYLVAFEVASILLLAAMIGAVVMGQRRVERDR